MNFTPRSAIRTVFLLAALVIAAAAGMSVACAQQQEPRWKRIYHHFQLHADAAPVAEDGIHDPNGEAIDVLQAPVDAMAGFPRDSAGIIDWVTTLNRGLIEPRQSRTGEHEMFTVDFDILFTNTQSMPWVRFPHFQHTQWLTCANCHPVPFIPKKGANPITMSAIIQGDFCGRCHGRVAFPPTMNCGRCHSVTQQEVNLLR